ncbi:MAG: AAA family ATPase [Clostridiales bacterium]|nr:AAA family ATPase [Clostridiales bacterium]
MIIHKLEMYNFRQFIGLQEVEFSTDPEKNVTVLIGVNTSGKTTIIRAFEWCLYGKNGFEDPVLLNSEVRDNMYNGDAQEVWVAVTFSHADSSGEKLYTLRRKFTYLCNERSNVEGKLVVGLNKKPEEDLSLTYLQADGQTKTAIRRENITESIDRVLPEDLSDYFFFGGERISGIANRTDLSKAVRGLMRLDVLENARDHIKEALKKFSGNIDTSGDSKAQAAQASLETAKKKLSQYIETRDNAQAEMEHYQQKENELNVELSKSNVDQVKKAKAERDRIARSITNEENRLENAIKAYVDMFNRRPYAFFGMPTIKKSLEVLENVNDQVECVPGMNQDSIDYLIHRGICICGTHLDPGSQPYQTVMQERRKLPPETIGAVVLNYKNKAEGYLSGSEAFFSDIEEKYREIRSIQRRIGELKDEAEEQSKLIVDDTDAKAIELKRREAHTKYVEVKADYDQAVRDIGGCERDIKNCEAAIEKYAKSSTKNRRLVRYITYATLVQEWLNGTYEEKEAKVRTELQARVNDNFAKMYHGERSILIDDKYRVKYSDVTTEESDGLKAVKSFAFISSLVSMAKDKILDDDEMQLGQVYPLVMDAPFSNVDEIHIDNICKILPRTANQVIMAVMQKDWEFAAVNLDRYVGKSYTIVKDKDAAGKEIDTATHIK